MVAWCVVAFDKTLDDPVSVHVGVPVIVKPERSNIDGIRLAAGEYVKNGRRYRADLRRLD